MQLFEKEYKAFEEKSQMILTTVKKIESTLSKKRTETVMKTVKRLLWVLLGIVITAVIGYFVYTGFQV